MPHQSSFQRKDIMKQLLSIVVVSFLCCCSNNSTCINGITERILPVTTKSFALDSMSIPSTQSVCLYEDSTGREILSFLNEFTNNIYFYDYSSTELIFRRKFGSDVIQGYCVDGRRHALYSYCNKKGVYSEYDMTSGSLEKDYLIKPQINHNKGTIIPLPYVTTMSPIGVSNGILTFVGLQAGEPKEESSVNRPVVLLFDETSGDVKYRVNYPSVYQTSNWGGRLTYRLPYYTLSPDGDKMLISFAACDSITVYDIVNDKMSKVYCGSGALKNPKPYSKKKYDISSSREFEWYMNNYSYEGILYDRYRQCYYRFGRLPFDDYKPTDRINKKPTVVIVMDSTMTVIGEYRLPDKYYIPGTSFVSEEGLNIQVYSNNDNIMLFDVFSLI